MSLESEAIAATLAALHTVEEVMLSDDATFETSDDNTVAVTLFNDDGTEKGVVYLKLEEIHGE